MLRTNCPSCGAELVFRASFSVFAVCAYCGATVVRTDRDVEAIGVMADLPAEMTPLQVGTELSYDGGRFTLVGRVRMAWPDGAWNEWYMLDGDRAGWLAEAQGFLAVSFEQPVADAKGLDGMGAPSLDWLVSVGGKGYRVTDIKEARCVGSEGELPFRAPRGRVATYADMLGEGAGFAGLEQSDDGQRLFTGEYVAFDRLGLRNLRAVEGWGPPATRLGSGDPLQL